MDHQDHLPGHHPHRGIFISLVFAIILLVGIFLLFIYSVFLAPEPEIEISELEQAIEDSILDQVEEAKVEEEAVEMEDLAKIQTLTFENISFDVPLEWHVARQYNLNGKAMDLSPNPLIYYTFGDDSFPGPVSLRTLSPVFELQAVEAGLDNVVITEIEQDNYTVYHVQGQFNVNMTPHNGTEVDSYYYLSRTEEGTSFEISFFDYATDAATDNEGWEIIKNSLDFSNIK